MTETKPEKNRNLIWIDLEMTGLNPAKDVILEIAVIVTDKNLNIIAEGPSIVISQIFDISAIDKKVLKMHADSGLFKAVEESTVSLQEAEKVVIEFLKKYCTEKSSPLCGNSVYNDRFFIKTYMHDLENFLHYRNLDVSTVKELLKHWYTNNPKIKFEKPENHRALEDIRYSIEELRHYRDNFFISPDKI